MFTQTSTASKRPPRHRGGKPRSQKGLIRVVLLRFKEASPSPRRKGNNGCRRRVLCQWLQRGLPVTEEESWGKSGVGKTRLACASKRPPRHRGGKRGGGTSMCEKALLQRGLPVTEEESFVNWASGLRANSGCFKEASPSPRRKG